MNTFVTSENILFTNVLAEYNGSVPDAPQTSSASIESDVNTYFGQVGSYYGGEDTIEIFGAAYDDAQWVVLEWLEAIKFINQYDSDADSTLGQDMIADFAHRAHIFYNIVSGEFNTSTCGGGLTWNPALATYKNSITNELFISSSVGMYLYFPGDNNTDPYPSPDYTAETGNTLPDLPTLAAHDPSLLQNAIEEYNWFQSQAYYNDQGLIIDGFHVSDGQTNCDEPDTMIYSYNQGVMLSGLRGLWEATGNTTYLEDGYSLINTVINATGWSNNGSTLNPEWSGLGRNGIMEDYCDAPANCTQDDLVFKGAYFHHLDLFCEPLPTSDALIPGLTYTASADTANEHSQNCGGYAPWVEVNAQAALDTRNSTGIIGEWWGASALNETQGPHEGYAVPLPDGAVDIVNQPWLMSQAPWACNSTQGECGTQAQKDNLERRLSQSNDLERRQSVDQVTTVETQGQGLAVVIAAADFTLNRQAF